MNLLNIYDLPKEITSNIITSKKNIKKYSISKTITYPDLILSQIKSQSHGILSKIKNNIPFFLDSARFDAIDTLNQELNKDINISYCSDIYSYEISNEELSILYIKNIFNYISIFNLYDLCIEFINYTYHKNEIKRRNIDEILYLPNKICNMIIIKRQNKDILIKKNISNKGIEDKSYELAFYMKGKLIKLDINEYCWHTIIPNVFASISNHQIMIFEIHSNKINLILYITFPNILKMKFTNDGKYINLIYNSGKSIVLLDISDIYSNKYYIKHHLNIVDDRVFDISIPQNTESNDYFICYSTRRIYIINQNSFKFSVENNFSSNIFQVVSGENNFFVFTNGIEGNRENKSNPVYVYNRIIFNSLSNEISNFSNFNIENMFILDNHISLISIENYQVIQVEINKTFTFATFIYKNPETNQTVPFIFKINKFGTRLSFEYLTHVVSSNNFHVKEINKCIFSYPLTGKSHYIYMLWKNEVGSVVEITNE